MKCERFVFILAALLLLVCFVESDNASVVEQSTQATTTSALLKCSRDYHCPSKCDSCISGICTHQLNLNCTRDYHCPACEVCRSGKCIAGERTKKQCTIETECEPGEWCLNGYCVENKCDDDSFCGADRVICKLGRCERI